MIYSWCTFLDCYSVFSSLQAYFLPTHKNGEVPVLGKLPYKTQPSLEFKVHQTKVG
jgi:hypothetical protein